MLRLFNARIANISEMTAPIGELWVEGDKIALVGESTPWLPEFERELDCRGNLLLPGFCNAHAHSAMTFLRSVADDKPLDAWLKEDVWPREAKLTPEDVLCFTKLAILEYLSGGITSAFDMYFHPDAVAQAATETGFRMVICGAANDFGGTVAEMRTDFEKFNKLHSLVSYRIGFHGEYTTSLPLLSDIAALANELKQPVAVHNSETRNEVLGCHERHLKSPTALLDDLGMWNYGGASFHCVHCDERDIEIFRERGIYCVANCGSNAKLASGIAPLTAFRRAGVALAIGTDGAASNNCLDFFREMFLMTGLQKLRDNDACAMPPKEVLTAATVGGAVAMGLCGCGELKAGNRADIVMLDLNRPNMQPINRPLENLVYSGNKQNVALTMVAGKILYENGEFVGIDAEKLYVEANERKDRLLSLT